MHPSRSIDVVIIGGGQAGLAMSRCLTDRSIDHVVLERGEAANSWISERWDSLRLLTPNWFSRLPGWSYRGDDPDGYMTAAEVVTHLERYRRSFDAPLVTGTEVRQATPCDGGYRIVTDRDVWHARVMVVATGACSQPYRPPIAAELPRHLTQLAPIHYRRPGQLDDRPVLVVGAAASGIQIADELAAAGRRVTLAVGEHVRLPRTYRGRDIHWWLHQLGSLDAALDDADRARRTPSAQLIGSAPRRDLDLNAVAARGVDVRGRLAGVSGARVQFSGSLANVCALADLKQARLLDEIDRYVSTNGLDGVLDAPERPAPSRIDGSKLELDLGGYGTVVWATGFRPAYDWLDPSLLDRRGRLSHRAGVLAAPGGYALGLPFLRRRKSAFLGGVGDDASELAAHLAAYLDRTARASVA